MNETQPASILEGFRWQVLERARSAGISTDPIEVVSARPLTPEEAIGRPERLDFPIQKGKEFMMEARYRGSRGQAFTSIPGEFQGTIEQALGRGLNTDFDRALAVATANAVLRYLNMIEKTVHCRDDGPRKCAQGIAAYLGERFGSPRVGIIGLQPALVTALKDAFAVRVTDLDTRNIGRSDLGVTIEGAENTKEMVDWADVVLVTGTVLANDTIDGILSTKPTVFYGVTIAGAAALLGFDRYCPCAD
jgi:hypothetical protein